jgi:hypothetical protein
VHLGKRTTVDGKVLREDVDETSVDGTVTSNDTISDDLNKRTNGLSAGSKYHSASKPHLVLLHAEISALVDDKLVVLAEAARVKEQVDPLAGRELAVISRARIPG